MLGRLLESVLREIKVNPDDHFGFVSKDGRIEELDFDIYPTHYEYEVEQL